MRLSKRKRLRNDGVDFLGRPVGVTSSIFSGVFHELIPMHRNMVVSVNGLRIVPF